MKHIRYKITCFILFFCAWAAPAWQAVVTVPVADLFGQPLTDYYRIKDAQKAYKKVPICGGTTEPYFSCPRMHQLLFNEIVEVVGEKGDEVKIKTPQMFYYTHAHHTPQHTFWTLKKNLTKLADLSKNGISESRFPQPIDFAKAETVCQSAITLQKPWHNRATGFTFSAGTRFVAAGKQKKKRATVFVYHPSQNKVKTARIPKKLVAHLPATKEEKIAQFVAQLRILAHQNHGAIAYVWGGTSFVTSENFDFKEVMSTLHGKPISYYVGVQDERYPNVGFDCAGIILRTAQMCGIPYFFKNTYTLSQKLASLKEGEPIRNGDLIWINGHVLIVSDVEKNLAIEARGYEHGFGKVQEIELKKVFKGISRFSELERAFFKNERIYRIDSNGNVRDSFVGWKILKMGSVF